MAADNNSNGGDSRRSKPTESRAWAFEDVRLSIIIVSFNTKDLLVRSLQSIYSRPSPFSIETVVVDNASKDSSVDAVKRLFPQVTVVSNRTNVGFARANNQALQLVKGNYILLLNSDTEVIDSALDTLISFLEEKPDVGMVNPKMIYPNGKLQPTPKSLPSFWRGEVFDTVFWRTPLHALLGLSYREKAYEEGRDYDQLSEIEWARGACLLMRRKAFESVGLLDPHFFFGYEETDYNLRAGRLGWRRYYVPSAVVVHHGSASHGQYGSKVATKINEAMFYYWEKNFGVSRGLLLRLVVVVTNLLLLMPAFILAMTSSDREGMQTRGAAILDQIAGATRYIGRPPPLA